MKTRQSKALAEMAHISGLVAGKVIPSTFDFRDIVEHELLIKHYVAEDLDWFFIEKGSKV